MVDCSVSARRRACQPPVAARTQRRPNTHTCNGTTGTSNTKCTAAGNLCSQPELDHGDQSRRHDGEVSDLEDELQLRDLQTRKTVWTMKLVVAKTGNKQPAASAQQGHRPPCTKSHQDHRDLPQRHNERVDDLEDNLQLRHFQTVCTVWTTALVVMTITSSKNCTCGVSTGFSNVWTMRANNGHVTDLLHTVGTNSAPVVAQRRARTICPRTAPPSATVWTRKPVVAQTGNEQNGPRSA